MPTIRILGGGREVGRAAYLVSDRGEEFLLDYGVNFDEEDRPQFPGHVRPIELSGVSISHAHLDHIAAAPLLYITGRPKAFMTRPTMEMGRILIRDFLKLNAFYIDYELSDLETMSENTIYMDYGEENEAGGFRVLMTSAGHILGSSLTYLITPSGHTIMYTGDVNTIQTWTLTKPELWPLSVDTLIIESTYGSTKHPPRHLTEKKLVESVEEVVEEGGTVLIPAFSVGRSQEMICLLHAELPHIDVYLDGMSRDITSLYLRHKNFLRDPPIFEKAVEHTHFVKGWQDRRKAWRKPGVIVSSAGMLKGGPSVYYLKKIGGDRKNAVFLVSYQAAGSPGHELLETGGIEAFGVQRLQARLQWFDLSSHAGKDGLHEIVLHYKHTLKNIVIIHGEPDAANNLAEMIRNSIGSDVNIYIPSNGDEIELES